MGQHGKIIADAATVGLRYAERLLGNIPEERFARMSAPGGVVINANHPAFILGHLCLYPTKVVELLGAATKDATTPEGFEEKFSKTATCVDDPSGSIYPSGESIRSFFSSSYAAALSAISEADDALLLSENPVDTPMKQVCPTLGSMLNFYLTGHVMVHLGQLSTWRRMEGLPPA